MEQNSVGNEGTETRTPIGPTVPAPPAAPPDDLHYINTRDDGTQTPTQMTQVEIGGGGGVTSEPATPGTTETYTPPPSNNPSFPTGGATEPVGDYGHGAVEIVDYGGPTSTASPPDRPPDVVTVTAPVIETTPRYDTRFDGGFQGLPTPITEPDTTAVRNYGIPQTIIDNAVTSVATVQNTIDAAIDAAYAACVEECKRVKSNCMACLKSHVDSVCDGFGKIKDNCNKYINARIESLVIDVATTVADVGKSAVGGTATGVVTPGPSQQGCKPYDAIQHSQTPPETNNNDTGLRTNCLPNRYPSYGDTNAGNVALSSGNWVAGQSPVPNNVSPNGTVTRYSYTAADLASFGFTASPPLCPGLPDNRPYVGQWQLVNPDNGEAVAYGQWNGSCDTPPWQYGTYPAVPGATPWSATSAPVKPPADANSCPCPPAAGTGSDPTLDGSLCGSICSPDLVSKFCECVGTLSTSTPIRQVFAVATDAAPLGITDFVGGLVGGPLVAATIGSVVNYVCDVVDTFAKGMTKFAGCESGDIAGLAVTNATFGLVDKWTGCVPDVIKARLQYAINCQCPYLLPSVNELNDLYQRKYIEEKQWKSAVKMLGACPDWQVKIEEMSRSRVDPIQTYMAFRRDVITEEEKDTLLDKLGMTDLIQEDIVKDATCQRPGMRDIMQMMTRDVTDNDVVDTYKLDEDFTEKYTDELKKYAKDQGVEDELAKKYWRMHWHMPSDGQLFDMLHRLRPGREPRNDGYDDVELTTGDIQKALQINDLMPYWVDKLMAISDRQLGRRELARVYCLGIITDDEMKSYLQDYGYNLRDAERLQKYYKQDNLGKGCAGSIGLTKNQILKYYKAGSTDREDAKSLLSELGLESDDIDKQLDAQDYIAAAERRTKEEESLRKRFMLGDLTDQEALSELSQIGIDQQHSNDVVNHWRRMLRYKRKEGTAALLCTWYSRGLLGISDFDRRLSNMGWSADDVIRIIQTCIMGVADKAKADADKLSKQKQKELDAAEKRRKDAIKRAAAARCSPAKKCLEDALAGTGV